MMHRKLSVSQKSSRKAWTARFLAWEESGLTQLGYCKKAGLNLRTFQYWRKKFNKLQNPKPLQKDQSVKIVQIKPEKCSSMQLHSSYVRSGIKVYFGDVSVELENQFNQDALLRLIRVLKTV